MAFFYSIPETLLTQLSQLSVFRDQADPIMDDFLSQSLTTDKTISPGFSELQQLFLTQFPPPSLSKEDIRTLKAAHAFFLSHKTAVFICLGFLSLPYCYAAEPGVKTLYLSDRFRNQTKERLKNTAEFVESVFELGEPKRESKVEKLIISVRMGHSFFRRAVIDRIPKDLGLPVNQEDMAGTHLAFSFLVLRGLRHLGFTISSTEAETWLKAWKIVGLRLGIDEGLLPIHQKDALALSKAIEVRHFRFSQEGYELTQKLTTVLTEFFGEEKDVKDLMKFLLGKDVSGILGLDVTETVKKDQVKWKILARLKNPEVWAGLFLKNRT